MNKEKISFFIDKYGPSFRMVWSARKPFLVINGVIAILTIIYLLVFVKPIYDCDVLVLPEYGGKNMLAGIGQLASLAGINVGDISSSPMEVYKNLVFSESVLEPVVKCKYKTDEFRDSVNLIQYFDIEADVSGPGIDPERAKFVKFYKMLTKRYIKTDLDPLTNILTIEVYMPERNLAVEVVNGIVNSLDAYVRTQRKSYASNQGFYLEKRLATVKDSLAEAEERLKDFQLGNKVIDQSPELMLKQQRLMRDVEISSTVFEELTKQLELSKLDKIRDTPVLNIEEYARDPIEKSGPNRRLMFVVTMLLSFVVSSAYYIYSPRLPSYRSTVRKYWETFLSGGKI